MEPTAAQSRPSPPPDRLARRALPRRQWPRSLPDRLGARDYFQILISGLMFVLGIRILTNLRDSPRLMILLVGLSFTGLSLYRLYWVAIYFRNRRVRAPGISETPSAERGDGG